MAYQLTISWLIFPHRNCWTSLKKTDGKHLNFYIFWDIEGKFFSVYDMKIIENFSSLLAWFFFHVYVTQELARNRFFFIPHRPFFYIHSSTLSMKKNNCFILLLANGLYSWSQQIHINSIIIVLAIKSQAVNL